MHPGFGFSSENLLREVAGPGSWLCPMVVASVVNEVTLGHVRVKARSFHMQGKGASHN